MRAIIVITFTCIFISNVQPQFLSFDQLIYLQKSDLMDVNDFLLKKGWNFASSEKSNSDDEYNVITWSYGENKINDKAQAWLSLYYFDDYDSRVSYRFFNTNSYDQIKAKIKAYNMKEIDTEIHNNKISSTFQGANYTIDITIGSNPNRDDKFYQCFLRTNEDYKYNLYSEVLDRIKEYRQSSENEIDHSSEKFSSFDNSAPYNYIYKTKGKLNSIIYRDKNFQIEVGKIYNIRGDVYVINSVGSKGYYVQYGGNRGYIKKEDLLAPIK